jgi:hypothetical protein
MFYIMILLIILMGIELIYCGHLYILLLSFHCLSIPCKKIHVILIRWFGTLQNGIRTIGYSTRALWVRKQLYMTKLQFVR